MTAGVALALIALCGIALCAVVVPAFFVRRHYSRRDPAGRAHRLASGALRLGWVVVVTALVLGIAASAIDNPLGHRGVP